ncbi:MAG: hypothetical protein ABI400_02085 [Lacisediminihabitans sp.]
MSSETQPQVVRSFLAQLEVALHDVPRDVSSEIVAGITEELAGLDAATAAGRIEELGDPVFIAAEARAGVAVPATPPTPPRKDPLWYIVVAGLLVAVGGIVVPILGWIVGIALVWLSKTWRTWEKWVATFLPVVVVALAAVVLIIVYALFAQPTPRYASYVPQPEPSSSPLLPIGPNWLLHNVLFMMLINFVVGIWLLWRALRHPRSTTGN